MLPGRRLVLDASAPTECLVVGFVFKPLHTHYFENVAHVTGLSIAVCSGGQNKQLGTQWNTTWWSNSVGQTVSVEGMGHSGFRVRTFKLFIELSWSNVSWCRIMTQYSIPLTSQMFLDLLNSSSSLFCTFRWLIKSVSDLANIVWNSNNHDNSCPNDSVLQKIQICNISTDVVLSSPSVFYFSLLMINTQLLPPTFSCIKPILWCAFATLLNEIEFICFGYLLSLCWLIVHRLGYERSNRPNVYVDVL